MTDYRMNAVLRAYRVILNALLPRRFGERFAHQMIAVFAELEAEARARAGAVAAWGALFSELPGLVRLAARESAVERHKQRHIPNDMAMRQPILESLRQDVRFAVRSLRRT